jgi:hypothetical protein
MRRITWPGYVIAVSPAEVANFPHPAEELPSAQHR